MAKIAQSGVQLIWQTGKQFLPEALKAVSDANTTGLHAYDFISRMDLAYAMTDLVISRAGASTVSELCIVGKPAVMVPLPTAAEDHQTKNIQTLVDRNAAMLVNDKDAFVQLVDKALLVIQDESRLTELRNNILKLALPGSAIEIARQVTSLAAKNKI